MQRAAEASAQGGKDRARELYATAARTYPTSKEPWQKLAQDHFESRNYGQAILAAQEVLQRDPADSVATSILAVSGLRVAAAALTGMRQQNRLNGDTRAEAEDIVRKLRDLLGEPVLVPPATGTAPAGGSAPLRPRPIVRPPAKPAASASAPAVAPQKGDSSANPFNLMTK